MNALLRLDGRTLKTNYHLQNFYTRYLKTSCCSCCTDDYPNGATGKECEHTQRRSTPTSSPSDTGSPLRKFVHSRNLFQHQSVFKYGYYYSGHGFRHLHSSRSLLESSTSKIDVTVKKLKNQQKEKVDEIMKEVANGQASAKTAAAAATPTAGADISQNAMTADGAGSSATSLTQAADSSVAKPKKSLGVRIWEEIVHYYHGFRLLFIDVAICSKLLWRVLNGKSLTRRENKQLQRTTSDLFRLIPFSVFIIVPFMELLLPFFIKFFPGMLPSTFQTPKDQQDKLRQSLGVRLEVAKFLQQTLDQMPVQHKEHSSEEAKAFEAFFNKIRHPSEIVSNEDIIKFAKRFDDEITLDSLSREQLAALCRVLEINTLGTSNLLRFQLRLKLRYLATDDRVIVREGVDTLDLIELQQACKARGMRAYGLTEERLRSQLQEWVDLSLNEKVPPSLLLLSRAMVISDEGNATDKLKETMRVLPDAVGAHTRHAIGESEGKVDNKTKIEIIKEEERRIQEEREEEHEEVIAKRTAIKDEQPAPYVFAEQLTHATHVLEHKEAAVPVASDSDKSISSTDVQMLSDALNTLSSDKQLVVEKETIKELKEELRDYKEDVEELREVRQVVKEPVRESRAAKLLYNRVNKMISQLDGVLNDLEHRQQQIKQANAIDCSEAEPTPERQPTVHIDELVATIKRTREASDEERFKVVEELLVKLDADQDGAISVNEITKVVQSIDSQATNIDKKQLEEFTELLTKQATKRRNEEIVHIDDLMQNIKKIKETSDDARLKHIEQVLDKFDADKDGVITVNEIRKVMESIGRDNIKLSEKAIDELICLLDKEQILHAEEKIERAIARSLKDAEKLKAEVDKKDKELANLVDGLHDSAKEIKDIASDLGAMDIAKKLKSEAPFEDTAQTLKDCAKDLSDVTPKPPVPPEDNKTNPTRGAPQKDSKDSGPPKSSGGGSGGLGGGISASAGNVTTEAVIREAAERQVEKLLPKDITLPPTIPTTPPPTTPPVTKKATAAASASPQPLSSANASKKVL
ncbi:mitochondrial proton/calcium exchanger protein-like [Drosophila miranda]|uniref:mitochondrial proton/calcium exchanger protein-like n=1 Tax=Drosophila miranda TaxID=7229 RepID=UPI00143F39A8|nr:mitochondrial proton/calcium exchanger protein-like [Drosophila miranda]XP_033253403.1 mitochondrial proton/calcium exchanger protein-like [Drosophila miranda]XP_033253404.1 mitochondrial proton/calcium exchanger protein-like [Drosophila miranda]XP_033253405.1 mitochondrial proton/calcium exchanger protein-like [Drosophila miranda]